MNRTTEAAVDPMFPRRTSPRAMSGEPLTRDVLLPLFEAARWAPSCSNSQPWRFVYGLAGTEAFEALLATLDEGNQVWAKKAGALVVLCSKKTMPNGSASPTPAFDAGAAWMSFALQGSLAGLVVHGMAGFDAERARAAAKVPDDHLVIVAIAVGKPGRVDDLPERLREREAPTPRQPLDAMVFEGGF